MKEFIAISDIKIANRIRKDMGDLTSLSESMDKLGQLQAVGLDGDNNLLFGNRRILAAKKLDWDKVWFERFDNAEDAISALLIEREENTERKDFTPLEMLDLANRLKAMKPKEKPGPKTLSPELPGKFPGNSGAMNPKPERRQRIAEAVGTSDKTLKKIEAVAAAAEAEPEKFAAVVEEMQRTGKVDPAFKKVKAATKPLPPREPKQTGPTFDMNAAKKEAEKAVRSAFRSWPESARKHIPTYLRQLANGDW